MNDKFLTQFQKEPNNIFKASLWQRLQHVVPVTQPVRTRVLEKRPFRLALAITLIGFFVIAGFSPGLQEQIEDVIRRIDGISFKETATYPGSGLEPIIVKNEEHRGVLEQLAEEARAKTGLQFNIPSFIPAGYEFDGRVVYGQVGGTSASFIWINQRTYYGLLLDIQRANPDRNWVVGPDSTEEVFVNGQPAALIRGGWNADTQQWDEIEGGTVLRWDQDGIEYSLTAFGNVLTDATLIAIAESIP